MAEIRRDTRLDWIKGFLIVCVVLGHTMRVGACSDMVDKIVLKGIYGFHMPLFMLIAGYFFKMTEPGEMVRKILSRVVLPYMAASVLLNAIYVCAYGRSLVDAFTGVIVGRANGALWFLYALAVIQLVLAVGVWIGQMRFGKRLAIVACAGLFALATQSPIRCEAWMLFYFGVGMLLARNNDFFPSGIIGVFGFVGILWYGHPWYTELCWQTIGLSLFALMSLHGLAVAASEVKVTNVFAKLGRHTMVILIFHPFFSTVYKFMMKPLLALDGSGIVFFLSSACFSVCSCLLLELALKKCRVGWLFGVR